MNSRTSGHPPAILVRFAKKSSNYLAVIQLACILLWFRRLDRLKNSI
ncbi:MAG: hypothetical protein KF866_12075 [Phycisphaeraceae bacterium]|nr:hypothetical protein [Phycisphaeraceae bacterium]